MNARKSEVSLLYSEADKATANLLADALNYYSIDIWEAKNISIGSKIINETTTALAKAKFVIVLWSANSIKSALLIELAAEVKRNNKVLIPVLIQNIRIPGEFLDIQPANLIGWDGDRESEQIVKLWILIRDQVLKYRSKKIGFNQFSAILTLIFTGMGVLVAIATPEIRCMLKLQCPDKSSSEKTIQSSEVTSQSPTVSNSPVTIQTTSAPQPTIANPLPDITPRLTPQNKASSQQTVEMEQFIFKLQSCEKSSQNIKCNLLITNTGKDKPLWLYGAYGRTSTRLFDLAGNEYTTESVEIGASQSTRYVLTQLIQDVNVKSSVNFVGIPSQVNEIKVLEIKTNLNQPVQFRDIVLSK